MASPKDKTVNAYYNQVSIFELNEENHDWEKIEELYHLETDTAEAMLQLKRGRKDRMLLGKNIKSHYFSYN